MKKLLVGLLTLSSITAFASNSICHQKIESMIKKYQQFGKDVVNYEIKTCNEVLNNDDFPPIFDEVTNTKAPKTKSTNACVVIFEFPNNRIQQLAVFDQQNKFILEREYTEAEEQDLHFSISRFGTYEDGIIMTIKDEFIGRKEYIIRAEYYQDTDILHLKKWRARLFGNKYSHDYFVQCK